MQTATHYRVRHLSITTGQVLRQPVTIILMCNRQSGSGHTGPEVRTGDNEPRRNAPFSSCSSPNSCFSVLLVLLIFLLCIFHSLFILILPTISNHHLYTCSNYFTHSYVFQLSVPIFLLSCSVFHSWIPSFSSSRFSLPCLRHYPSSLIFSASSCLLLSCFIV
jgi:hypothetical protein